MHTKSPGVHVSSGGLCGHLRAGYVPLRCLRLMIWPTASLPCGPPKSRPTAQMHTVGKAYLPHGIPCPMAHNSNVAITGQWSEARSSSCVIIWSCECARHDSGSRRGAGGAFGSSSKKTIGPQEEPSEHALYIYPRVQAQGRRRAPHRWADARRDLPRVPSGPQPVRPLAPGVSADCHGGGADHPRSQPSIACRRAAQRRTGGRLLKAIFKRAWLSLP